METTKPTLGSPNDSLKQEIHARIEALEKELGRERRQREEAETRADVVEELLKSLRSKIHNLEQEVHAQRSSAAEASAKVAEHKRMTSKSRQEHRDLKVRFHKLQHKKAVLELQVISHKGAAFQNLNPHPPQAQAHDRETPSPTHHSPPSLPSPASPPSDLPQQEDTLSNLEPEYPDLSQAGPQPTGEDCRFRKFMLNFRPQRDTAPREVGHDMEGTKYSAQSVVNVAQEAGGNEGEVEQDVQPSLPPNAGQGPTGAEVFLPTAAASQWTASAASTTPIISEGQHIQPNTENIQGTSRGQTDVPSPATPVSQSTASDTQQIQPSPQNDTVQDLTRDLSEDINWTKTLSQKRLHCETNFRETINGVPSLEKDVKRLEEERLDIKRAYGSGTMNQTTQDRWNELRHAVKDLRGDFDKVKRRVKVLTKDCQVRLVDDNQTLTKLQNSLHSLGSAPETQVSGNHLGMAIRREVDQIHGKLREMDQFFDTVENDSGDEWREISNRVRDLMGNRSTRN